MLKRIWLVILFTLAARPAIATDITGCDQLIENDDTGVLVTDLSCPDAYGVRAGVQSSSHRASRPVTIQLNGHTISAATAVLCNGRCTIEGPGTLSGDLSAIYVSAIPGDLTLRNLTITNSDDAIGQGGRSLTLENVSITDNAGGMVLFASRRVTGTNVTLSRNGQSCITAGRARVSFTGLTAEDNTGTAILGRRVTLVDSALSSNVLDIQSRRRPELVNTTCETSMGAGADGSAPWGVCAND